MYLLAFVDLGPSQDWHCRALTFLVAFARPTIGT